MKGITGFGFSLIALPLLSFWFSPKDLIPVLILCNLTTSLIIVLQKKDRKLINEQSRSLIFFGAMFSIFGVIAMKHITEQALIWVLCALFIAISVYSLLGFHFACKASKRSNRIAGAFIGFISGSTSIDGPPLVLFLNSINADKQEFREIIAWFSLATATISLLAYAFFGLLTMQTLKMTLVFLPILFLGSFLGKRLNHYIPFALFRQMSLFMSLFSSILLMLH
jgi:uncharacterized membrane protein YfcA